MKWLLAGLLFALGVVLAIGTAALRTDNVVRRYHLERQRAAIADRLCELRRLSVLRASKATPERLAEVHWAHLRTEVAARRERLQ
jgi:hypothetical protein